MPRLATLAAICLLWLTACAAGPNLLNAVPGADGVVAGFWAGLWHGLILPFAFLGSLFFDGISIYEVHNNGGWYHFGYLIGVAATFERGGRVVVLHRNRNEAVTPHDV